jgi:hypothetical protein
MLPAGESHTTIVICSMKWRVPVCFEERLRSRVLGCYCRLGSGAAAGSSQLTLISGGDGGGSQGGHCSRLSGSLSGKRGVIDGAQWIVEGPKDGSLS